VGGYWTSNGGNVALVLDGDWENPVGGGKISVGNYEFFGVIDTGPTGMSEVQFREMDGRISDAFFIFGDDFTLLAEPTAIPVPGLGALASTALGSLLLATAIRSLRRRSA
jgi:hypothetical protein